MKKRDIWLSIAIIAAALFILCGYFRSAGRIEIDSGGAVAMLQLRSNWFRHTAITSGAARTSVGAGVHRPKLLSVSMERDGHDWRIDSRGPWMNLSRIRVKSLRTTSLRLGPPFHVRPGVRRNGSFVDIDFTITGQAGERYQRFAVMDGRAVQNSGFRIMDDTGKMLKAGKFRYG